MTQPDPFEGLGGGGFDMNALLAQAQQMQQQLELAQADLAEATVQGSVADGAVAVTVTGTGELAAVTVQPGRFDGGDAEDLADLGDLVVAAYRDAKARADALAAEKLGPLAGGLTGLSGASDGDEPRGQLGF